MNERPKVGLASNPRGIPFQCGDCQWYKKGACHNKDPELFGYPVEEHWCCDLFEHPGMKVIIK